MTLAPLDSSSVRGVPGKPGELTDYCIAPGCQSAAQQRHHFWPKSYLRGQPYEWVEVDGFVIQNSGGLCMFHHGQVTGGVGGHKAHIRWMTNVAELEWWTRVGEDWVYVANLRGPAAVPDRELVTEASVARSAEDLCPTCGKPRHKGEPKPRRKSRSWNIEVPADEEDGAEVLETLLEDFSSILGFDGYPSRLRRYHTISKVLAWAQVHRGQFIEDWVDASQ